MSEHTPGPWKRGMVEHNPMGYTVDIDGGSPSERIATVECYEGDESDLELVLAAPDLLAACKAMLHAVQTYGHFDKTDRMARAAIAKAKNQPAG